MLQRLREADPFALALVAYAIVLGLFSAVIGFFHTPASVPGFVTAGLIGAMGWRVQRQVRG